jgi:hypothetical protein
MKARRSEKKAGRIRKGDQRRHSAKAMDRSQRGDEMEPLDADVGFETGMRTSTSRTSCHRPYAEPQAAMHRPRQRAPDGRRV